MERCVPGKNGEVYVERHRDGGIYITVSDDADTVGVSLSDEGAQALLEALALTIANVPVEGDGVDRLAAAIGLPRETIERAYEEWSADEGNSQ